MMAWSQSNGGHGNNVFDHDPGVLDDNAINGIVRLARAVGSGRVPAMSTPPDPYRGYRHPPEIISHAVWLYHCFSLSLREVELILAERGVAPEAHGVATRSE